MSKTGQVILGLVGFAAIGITIGILIAPEKGAEIRKKICDLAGDFATNISEVILSGKNKINGTVEAITKETEGVAGESFNESAI